MYITLKIEIAIAMLGSSIRDRYWNRLTHSERNIIVSNAINILEEVLVDSGKLNNLIIPNNCQSHNPPDEP
jgi:hypothetical protein